jgi:hypothetical protein
MFRWRFQPFPKNGSDEDGIPTRVTGRVDGGAAPYYLVRWVHRPFFGVVFGIRSVPYV